MAEINHPGLVTIYIPHKLLSVDTCGVLLGCRTSDRRRYCVVSMLGLPSNPQHAMIKNFEKDMTSNTLTILGFYENSSSTTQEKMCIAKCLEYTQRKRLPWVHLHQTAELWPEVSVLSSSEEEAILIVHDPHVYLDSVFLYARSSIYRPDSEILKFLSNTWTIHKEHCHKVSSFTAEADIKWIDFLKQRKCITKQITSSLLTGLQWLIFFIAQMLYYIEKKTRSTRALWSSRVILYQPACIMQLRYKYCSIFTTIPQSATDKLNMAKWHNSLWRHLLDTCMGVLLMTWLLENGYPQQLSQLTITWAQVVVGELQKLLDWLKGAPAGLKLNAQLSHCLAGFFQYHIYLWTGYLQVLRPMWDQALTVVSVSGCLGLTMQLSLIQDLLTMMTLHSYCFYVYAARLYYLQVLALASLWRLFRGRKWNPLRERVDSVTYDVDQLFLGTLLFTILLFLMPTTILYYGVFALLRIGVLLVQGLLQSAINVINISPVYFTYLRLVNPQALTVDVLVCPYQEYTLKVFPLALQNVPVGWKELWGIANPATDNRLAESWMQLGGKLVKGQLIYPWIPPKVKS